MRKFLIIRILLCCAVVVGLISSALPVSAEAETKTFEVDTFEDLVDFAPNGECSAGQMTGGPCSLRAAVQDARTVILGGGNAPRNVHIKLPPGTYLLTLEDDPGIPDEFAGDLDLDLPSVNGDMSVIIEGTGAQPSVIDAGMIDRVLEIKSGNDHHVILRNLVIKNGLVKSTLDDDAHGGGVRAYLVALTVENVRFINNEAKGKIQGDTYEYGGGGGLSVINGKLIMSDSEFYGNQADSGSALYIWDGSGGDLYYAFIQRTSFHDNESHGYMGSVINANGLLYLVNSTVAHNSSTNPDPNANWAGVETTKSAYIHNSTLQITGWAANLFCRFKPCYLRNNALIREPKGGGYGNNCQVQGGGSIVTRGGNVMDDNSCAPNANLSDSVIAPDAWGMAFAGQYYLPFEGSPVINHLPGECVALGLSQSTPPTPGQLQTVGWC